MSTRPLSLAEQITTLVRDGGNATDLLMELRDYVRPRPQYSAPFNTRVLALCDGQWRVGVRTSDVLASGAYWYDDDARYRITPSHWLPLPPGTPT